MKVGVFTVLLASRPLEEALDYAEGLGCETVEKFRRIIKSRNLEIGILSRHGHAPHLDESVVGCV